MKKTLSILALVALAGAGLAYSRRAHAVSQYPGQGSAATYVNPAFAPPKAPQTCGEDAGMACQLGFDAGSCLRIAASGTWRYQVGPFDQLPDAGPVINLATGALYTLPDAGPVTYPDGGSYPDGGTYLGGVVPYPRLTPLFDGQVEGWCFYGKQSQLSAISSDGGRLDVSERYP